MQPGPSQRSDVAVVRRRSLVTGDAPATATAAQDSAEAAQRTSVQRWLDKSATPDDADEEMIDELSDHAQDERRCVQSEADDDDELDDDEGDGKGKGEGDDEDEDEDEDEDGTQAAVSKSSTPQRVTRSAAKGKKAASPKKPRSSASKAQRRKPTGKKPSSRKAAARKGKAVAGADLSKIKVMVSGPPFLPMLRSYSMISSKARIAAGYVPSATSRKIRRPSACSCMARCNVASHAQSRIGHPATSW